MNRSLILPAAAVIAALAGIAAYALTRPAPAAVPIASVEDASPLPPESYAEHEAYYDITAHYPQATPLKSRLGSSADTAALSVMKSFVTDTVAEFKTQGRFDALSPKDLEMLGFDQGRKWTLDIAYLISYSPRTVSYIFTIGQDTGGAHGNQFFRTFTFDLGTGKALALADLFDSRVDYLEIISALAAEKLTTNLAPYADERMIADGTKPDAKNFESFFIDNDNLNLLFPPYQVAPYAAGPQTVVIPLSTFGDKLKSEYRPAP